MRYDVIQYSKLTKSKGYNTAKYRKKVTKFSDISNGYTVLFQGRSVNDVCITNGVICMYKTVNLKLSYLQN